MPRPFTYGRRQRDAGRRAKSGKCHLCFVPDSRWGDATDPSVMIGVTRIFRPEKIVGMCLWASGTTNAGSFVFGSPSQGAATAFTSAGREVSTDAGVTISTPLRTVKSAYRYTGTGVAAPTQFSFADNRVATFGVAGGAGIYRAGQWFEGKPVTVRHLIYGENSAAAPVGLYPQILRGVTYDRVLPSITNLGGAAGLRSYDVTSTVTTGAPTGHIIVEQASVNGTGASFTVLPPRFFTGEVGMQLDALGAAGGYSTKTWADAIEANPTLFAAYWLATDATDIVITAGTNDAGVPRTKAAYKAELLRLIALIKTAVPGVTIWLVSTYPMVSSANDATFGSYADAMYETAVADEDCIFVDLLAYFGDTYAFASQFMTGPGDGTHPNEKGCFRSAAGVWAGVEAMAVADLYLDVDDDGIAAVNVVQTNGAAVVPINGGGAFAVNVTVTNAAGGAAIVGANVRMTDASGSYEATTNASGVAGFNLNASTYTLGIFKAGFLYASTSQVVSGAANLPAAMTQIAIAAPAGPEQTTAWCVTRDATGALKPGTTIYFQLVDSPGDAGTAFDRRNVTATSDGAAMLQLALLKGRHYKARHEKQKNWTDIPDTGTASTFALPEILSDYGS